MPTPSPQPSAFVAFAAAMECVATGVVVVDGGEHDAGVVYANRAFTRMTGYTASDALTGDLDWLAHADNDAALRQRLRTALKSQQAFSAEVLASDKDQRLFWSRLSLEPLRDAENPALIVVTCEDISAHKRARESLRASEARLDVAMEASGLSMWDWNVVSDQVFYNDQWGVSLGVDPRTLLERVDLAERLMLPADAPQVLEEFERHCRGELADFTAEYRLPTHSGEPKWFEAHARVVRRDEHGNPQRVIGVLRDISSRKLKMQETLEVQQRWQRAVHGTADGLYDWNLLTGHVWYAERFRELIGYDEKEFPDTFHAFQQVLHVDDRPIVMSKIRAHLENRNPLDLRCRVTTGRSMTIWCRLRGKAERDAAGRPTRLSGSISDISAQIEAEEALGRSQDFYGTLLDSMPLFIAFIDRDERIVYANRLFQEFFNVGLATSRGQKVGDIIGLNRYEMIASALRQAFCGKTLEGQGQFRDGGGKLMHLDASFVPHRDENGDIQGCFIAARDVTERRLLEAELRQSQKMEAIGRLTGGIAHDFNNLLSVIVGNTQLLARSLRESPRLLRQADTALKAAMRGGELTRRLLAFARQQALEPHVVELNAAIGGMYELLRRTLTGEIEIQQMLEPCGWRTRADPGQLENAVLNLVINARDAMPQGGVITLITRNVSIGAERAPGEEALPDGDYAVLEVKDTGTGMSSETLKRVFEPFFTTKEVSKGSGLGLSMVYGFVKQSGGHVSITSDLGRGTCVHLYFPRTLAAIESAGADNGVPADLPRGQETLLVVEDSGEVRATAVEILGTLGYRILEAANGHQAMEKFMQYPEIALVFSDIMLPGGLLGTNLVQKLRERRPTLKVLLTSGFSESSILHRGILDGSIEVLAKPYSVEDLARRIRTMLDTKEKIHRVPA